MVSKLEAEITAMQADFAGRMSWLRSNYLPDPLPKAVEDCLAELERHYDTLRDMVEDQEATAAYRATRNQETVPDEIAGRLLAGENPIRVWREYRGLSLRSLAEQIGTSPSALSDMETGKSKGRPENLQRIAGILHVSMDELLQSPDDDANTPDRRREPGTALSFRVVKPRYEDDPVEIVGRDGNERVVGFISVTTMEDLFGNGMTPAERFQYARDCIPALSRLIGARYRASGIKRVEITLQDLETARPHTTPSIHDLP